MNDKMLVTWTKVLDGIFKIMAYRTGSQCNDIISGTKREKRGDRVTTTAKQFCTC